MKRLAIIFAVLLVFSVSAHAQTSEGSKPEQKRQVGHSMAGDGMMSMCKDMMGERMPMMKHMMGHGMMMHDMMYIMMDMMKMQQKILRGVNPDEQKELISQMNKMMEKMEKMMSEMPGMMRGGMMHMMPDEPKNSQQKKETPSRGAPKSQPHKH